MTRTSFQLQTLFLAVALVAAGGAAYGQDTQYWTQQYGTRAELLGGTVVGSFLDLSSTFYNPGALVLMDNPDVLLSANAFEYFSIAVKPGIASGESPSTSSFGSAPTLFAGLFPKSWAPGRLAYSALTRQSFNVRIVSKRVGEGDVVGDGGLERYSSEFLFDQRLSEVWYGLTWSNLLRKHVGFGVTMYGVYRGQGTRVESISAATPGAGEGASLTYIDDFDYSHYRLIWKFGLALDYEPLTLGVALTTPSLGLFGSGSAQYTRSATGVDLNGDGTPDALLASDSQENLDASYKSPLAVAAGASYRWSRAAFHVSAEWFHSVDRSEVMAMSGVPEVPLGSTIARRTVYELSSVLNIGAGFEYKLSDKFTGYGSLTTDRSAAVPGTESRQFASTWDIYHVSSGAALRLRGVDLTLGARYSFGGRDFASSFESVPALGGDPMAGSKIAYRAWKVIVGFAFSL
jgi:hypothetical protein